MQQKRIAVYTNDTAILFMVIKGLNSVVIRPYKLRKQANLNTTQQNGKKISPYIFSLITPAKASTPSTILSGVALEKLMRIAL